MIRLQSFLNVVCYLIVSIQILHQCGDGGKPSAQPDTLPCILDSLDRPLFSIEFLTLKGMMSASPTSSARSCSGAVDDKIDYDALERRGDVDMYSVFEETRMEGRSEGRVEGRAEEIIETGHEFGLSDDDILGRLQRKLDVSLEMAQGYLRQFGGQTV